MKKTIATMLILCIALSLVACSTKAPIIEGNNDTSTSATTEEQTEITTITLEQFLDRVGGIWIIKDTLQFFDDGSPYFDALMILDNQCTTAAYPGGVDRPGLYEGFTQIDENTFQLSLLYEATSEESYYGYTPEERCTITLVLTGNDTMQVQYENGTPLTLIYGGTTFEEASMAVTDRKN